MVEQMENSSPRDIMDPESGVCWAAAVLGLPWFELPVSLTEEEDIPIAETGAKWAVLQKGPPIHLMLFDWLPNLEASS